MINRVPVVFSVNDAYVMPLCVAITSMKLNKSNDTTYDITVMFSKLSAYSKAKLKELETVDCKIQCLDVSRIIEKNYTLENNYITQETYYRFYIADLFPEEEKVLYLDCDLLVRDDLTSLFATEMADAYAVVASDIDVEERLYDINYVNDCYFNAGVILFNLVRMRKDGIKDRLLSQHGNYTHMDQDILNIVLGHNVKYVSEIYNFQIGVLFYNSFDKCKRYYNRETYTSYSEYINNAKILHLAGPFKPWCFNVEGVSDLFAYYFSLSNYSANKLHLYPLDMGWKELREYPILKYLMPELGIPDNSRLILYGANFTGLVYLQQIIAKKRWKVIHWIDKEAEDYQVAGLPIESVNVIKESDFDFIVIADEHKENVENIVTYLAKQGVDESKIIWKGIQYHEVITIRDIVSLYIKNKIE